jgi:hypothetical protein
VQFANDARVEAHVYSGKLNAGGQLANGGLSRPSTFL